MERKFILCYHDFSVRNFRRASKQIRLLSDTVCGPIAIAVIPSTEGVAESDVRAFKDELNRLTVAGHELLLHGSKHLASQPFPRSVFGKAALFLTNNEAEFAGLDVLDSSALLEQAMERWNALSLPSISGFVPPAWYGNPFLKKQVLEKFEFYDGRFAVAGKSRNGKRTFSPAVSFAGLPGWSLPLVTLSAKIILHMPLGVLRLVFHPVDFESLGEEKILSLVKEFIVCRKKILYRNLKNKKTSL